jgi:mannose-6-phosphate isomerase-like protein (cupin superfamily)
MSFAGQIYDGEPVRMEVLRTGAETDGKLHEMRATYVPDSPLPPAHLHPNQDERFEVLEGTLRFLIDDTEHIVPAGQAIDVPRGSVHQVHNPEQVPAVVIWQTRPALRTAEFFHAINTTTATEDWDGLTVALREYRDVFLMVPDPFVEG